MVAHDGNVKARLKRSHMPVVPIPGELFTVYQPLIGHQATLLWLNLRFQVEQGESFSPETLTAAGMTPEEIRDAFARLQEYRLLSEAEDSAWIVHDPLPSHIFHELIGSDGKGKSSPVQTVPLEASVVPSESAPSLEQGPKDASLQASGGGQIEDDEKPAALRVVSAASEASSMPRSPLSRGKRRKSVGMLKLVEADEAWSDSDNPDMQAVAQIYHKRIGMMGPTQYEKLRFWIEEQGMEGAVVALAIEETVHSADVPRISYLEGILRNWYNDGIRTFAELQERKKASKVLSAASGPGEGSSHEGFANAAAYESVSPEMVAKWKELYPDEYDS